MDPSTLHNWGQANCFSDALSEVHLQYRVLIADELAELLRGASRVPQPAP